MDATEGEQGPGIEQLEFQRDEIDQRCVLTRALSRIANVTENQCFDHNICTENHPGASKLRMELEKRWNDLIAATISSPSSSGNARSGRNIMETDRPIPASPTSVSWLEKIYERHTETGRHYHTVVHLWEMFELLDTVIDKLNVPNWYAPMAWSVFFHDSIYDPKSNRNEKDSAELFCKFVDDCTPKVMDKKLFDNAHTMILATEKHKVIQHNENDTGMSEEQKLEDILMQQHFLDIDMAVLGKQKDAYNKYAALIRKEYEFVPHDIYCSKRADILESFLGGKSDTSSIDGNMSLKKSVFLTKSFREAFEEQARENLRNEIMLLRKNTIPGQ